VEKVDVPQFQFILGFPHQQLANEETISGDLNTSAPQILGISEDLLGAVLIWGVVPIPHFAF